MSEIKMEFVGWTVGIILFGIAALFPRQLIFFLGIGRVTPSARALSSLRILAALCFFGTIYRIIWLFRQSP